MLQLTAISAWDVKSKEMVITPQHPITMSHSSFTVYRTSVNTCSTKKGKISSRVIHSIEYSTWKNLLFYRYFDCCEGKNESPWSWISGAHSVTQLH